MQNIAEHIPTLLTIADASRVLRRSIPSLRRDLRHRKMAFVKVGGSIRISAEEIHRTIKAGTVERVAG